MAYDRLHLYELTLIADTTENIEVIVQTMLQIVPATFGLTAGMEYTLFKVQTINASKKETLSCNTTIVRLSNKDNTLCELQKLV